VLDYQIILGNDLGVRAVKVGRQRVNLNCGSRRGVAHVAGIRVVLQVRDHGEIVRSRRHSTLERQLLGVLVNGKEVLASVFNSQLDCAVRRQKPNVLEGVFLRGPCHGYRWGKAFRGHSLTWESERVDLRPRAPTVIVDELEPCVARGLGSGREANGRTSERKRRRVSRWNTAKVVKIWLLPNDLLRTHRLGGKKAEQVVRRVVIGHIAHELLRDSFLVLGVAGGVIEVQLVVGRPDQFLSGAVFEQELRVDKEVVASFFSER